MTNFPFYNSPEMQRTGDHINAVNGPVKVYNNRSGDTTRLPNALKVACTINEDFSYQRNACDPYAVVFTTTSTSHSSIKWLTGDGASVQNQNSISHVYSSFGNYDVKMILTNATCTDTISKTISVNLVQDDMIITPDTTICAGAKKLFRTNPSLKFCWSPVTFLDNPNLPNPTATPPGDITYYFTSESIGNSLIVNGNFSAGNTGFTSGYNYTNDNITEGQFYVGANPKAWNPSFDNCVDHTTGSGNMLLLNGSAIPNVEMWKETITITPNTNYAFSAWVQALFSVNPAQLRFSINGRDIGNLITASLPTCTWTQFYTTWNSGNNTTASISIINKNTLVAGNDFALDDISFAPVLMKRDSVILKVEKKSQVKTVNDTTICKGDSVRLNTTGSTNYTWTPSTGLSNNNTDQPVAAPLTSTQYIVTGTTSNGCSSKDSVSVNVFSAANISVSNDTSICIGSSLQLIAKGGKAYQWSPIGSLDNPGVFNPIAGPSANTMYNVQITDINNCRYKDSVSVTIRAGTLFSASPDTMICEGSSVPLKAAGGNKYTWSPGTYLDNPLSSTPTATPLTTIQYSVDVSDSVCKKDSIIVVNLTLRPNPVITASSSNDINCANLTSQLSASGAVSYTWTPVTGLSNANIANPVASISSSGLLVVTGTDQYGCKNKDSVTIKVTNDNLNSFQMPNAFTPNGDGMNDCFGIRRLGNVQVIQFSIYNRWGQCVFNTKDPSQCWDGSYKGIRQGNGVYAYIIKTKGFCGDFARKGTVLLVR